jgi:hypothetical protein
VKARDKLVAGLLMGAAFSGLEAQQLPKPAIPDLPVQLAGPPRREGVPAEIPQPTHSAVPSVEIRGTDGKPLPPEIQRQLEEQLRKNPPPGMGAQGSPRSGGLGGDIVVTGHRPRGSVVGDIPPERTFNQFDIKAFGADNIGTLLEVIGPQVASNRGRGDNGPVTLLNGNRVSDFSEIARIPSEAIERMEVFPEEVALKYGYRADQKVINVVTLQRFRSRVAQTSFLTPTEGARDTVIGNADYLALRGDTRLGLGMTYNRSHALLESDRSVRQFSSMPQLGLFRTLLPETRQVVLNGLISGRVLDDVSATMVGRFEVNSSESLLGVVGADPLRRNNDRRVAHFGTTLGGRSGRWLWTVTGNYDRTNTEVSTDIADGTIKRHKARSIDVLANADLLLTGPIVELPAGPLSASVTGGVEFRDFESRSSLGGIDGRSDLARDRGMVRMNLDLPLLSRRGERSSSFGNLSANANFAIERISDAGSLRTFGYGLTWSPVEAVGFNASGTNEESAPTLEQLGGPLLVTPNVRTFDFVRGEVVDATRVYGGNPALRTDDRHVFRMGVNVRPLHRTDMTLSLDYVATRIDDPIVAFPIVTPQIEAAFPGRFTRDDEGRLFQIDGRSLNFAESRQEQVRWGINFTRPLGPVPSIMQNAKVRVFASEAEARRAIPGAVFTQAKSGSAMAQGVSNLASRLFVSLYHNWYLKDRILLREGLPVLDLLGGGAVDFRGGRRRHEVEFQVGAFKRGLGARLTAAWQSGTGIHEANGAAGNLRFSDFSTVNLDLFANLAERFGGASAPTWLKGTRGTIGVTNLLNTRPQVRDQVGATPLSYQPAYFDPIGRTLRFNLRKVF